MNKTSMIKGSVKVIKKQIKEYEETDSLTTKVIILQQVLLQAKLLVKFIDKEV